MFFLTARSSIALDCIAIIIALAVFLAGRCSAERWDWLRKFVAASFVLYLLIFIYSGRPTQEYSTVDFGVVDYVFAGCHMAVFLVLTPLFYFIAQMSRWQAGEDTLVSKRHFTIFSYGVAASGLGLFIYLIFNAPSYSEQYVILVAPALLLMAYATLEYTALVRRMGGKRFKQAITFSDNQSVAQRTQDLPIVFSCVVSWLFASSLLAALVAQTTGLFPLNVNALLVAAIVLTSVYTLTCGVCERMADSSRPLNATCAIKYAAVLLCCISTVTGWAMLPGTGSFSDVDQQILGRSGLFFAPQERGYKVAFSNREWSYLDGAALNFSTTDPISIPLPFSFPFFGKSYSRVNLYQSGLVVPSAADYPTELSESQSTSCRIDLPSILVFCGNTFPLAIQAQVTEDALALTWGVRDGRTLHRQGEALVRALFFKSGKIRIDYTGIKKAQANGIAQNFRIGDVRVSNGNAASSEPLTIQDIPFISAGSVNISLEKSRRLGSHAAVLIAIKARYLALCLAILLVTVVIPISVHKFVPAAKPTIDSKVMGEYFDRHPPHSIPTASISLLSEYRINTGKRHVSGNTSQYPPEDKQDDESAHSDERKILSKEEMFLVRLLAAIEDHASDFEFTVEVLADVMCLSPRQLHRKVVDVTGKTPAAFIREYRLSYVKKLLSAGAVNVTEAANSVGFRDAGHFSRLYEDHFGESPSDVLRQIKKKSMSVVAN